ncbi:hypothetical protein MNBD_GAMMA16-301, partial [hydrothermal vent metagenome]
PPLDSNLPAVREFKTSLAKFYPSVAMDYVSFEGFIVAKIVTEAVKKMGQKIDRDSLVSAIESFSELDVGIGQLLHYSKQEHQGSHYVWLTRIDNNNVVAANFSDLH